VTLEIQVGSPDIALHEGYTVVASARDGQFRAGSSHGLYFLDTRLINAWRISGNGRPWNLLSGGAIAPSVARIYLTNPDMPGPHGKIPQDALGLVVSRHLEGGMHEDIEITNYSEERVCFKLTIQIAGDFADIFEVKSNKITSRGKITTEWDSSRQRLTTRYRNKDFSRAFRVTPTDPTPPARLTDGSLCFDVTLEPDKPWHCCLLYDFADGDDWRDAPRSCIDGFESFEARHALEAWQASTVRIDENACNFTRTFAQAVTDMTALRLPIEGTDDIRFVPAAGLPWFVALFGRDSLISSLQTTIVHPEFAVGALRVLAAYQAKERDDYRDAEPGKILHELRRGELAHFKLIPHTPYYGTADATPLYLVTLHSAWMTHGETSLLKEHIETAERCLSWIDEYGDRDGDGFQEYQTRSRDGYENQGWKDSGEAVVCGDGSLAKGPKALCELQGYVYDAWLRMAQVYDTLGNSGRACELRAKAARLFDRFNDEFWNEREGTYFFGLDGDKNKIDSVVSNAGHCLWSGIAPPERARRVADRLMQDDMWSGWGIRTLSSEHPAFNPNRYQVGSVWPHDNGLIAQGMKRYGFHDEALRIAHAITCASDYFEMNQIPELFAGTSRARGEFPVRYRGANVPQGWAAGSIFSLLQAMIGFQPDAPNGMLYLDPKFADWMPELIVRNLKVGKDAFDIHFTRKGSETHYEVLAGPATHVARRPMTEWAALLRKPQTST
jgi:glycogen debranching enzyme